MLVPFGLLVAGHFAGALEFEEHYDALEEQRHSIIEAAPSKGTEHLHLLTDAIDVMYGCYELRLFDFFRLA